MAATQVSAVRGSGKDYMLRNDFIITRKRECYHSPVTAHHHDFYEIYILVEGSISYIVEQKTSRLREGDILIISTQKSHRPAADSPSMEIDRYVLSINPQLLTSGIQPELDLTQCFYFRPNEGFNLLHPDAQSRERIMDILNRMLTCRSDDQFGSTELARLYFTELMIMFNRVYLSQSEDREDMLYNALIHSVIRYITENLTADLSLDSISAAFFVSKFHLSREFKRCTGCTLHRFITQKRLAVSKELIRQNIPVMQVYPLCGFTEYSVFLKAFKQEYNMTPKEFACYVNKS